MKQCFLYKHTTVIFYTFENEMLHARFFDTRVSRYSSSPSAGVIVMMLALSNSTHDYVPAQAEVNEACHMIRCVEGWQVWLGVTVERVKVRAWDLMKACNLL